MQSTRQGRIQILTATEIDDLYRRPEFNQTEREEFFSLDTLALGHVRKMEKLESKIHFILFIGYFRSKPVIPQFHLRDVRQDVRYICQTYFAGAKPQYTILPKSTRSRLMNQVIDFLGFEQLTPQTSVRLATRLQDVATIYNNPRYIFDECIGLFGATAHCAASLFIVTGFCHSGNEHRAATDGTDPFSEYVEKRSQDTSVHNG